LIEFYKISKEAGGAAFMNIIAGDSQKFSVVPKRNGAYGKIHAVIADLLCELCERKRGIGILLL